MKQATLAALAALGFGPQSDPRRPAASGSIDSAIPRKAGPADDGEFLRRVMLDQ